MEVQNMLSVATGTKTMSSLDIAKITGKLHKHVMEAIRKMESAWVKVNGSKFRLVDYTDHKGEKRPCYQLTKTECLYIATKFNDEARAKLVLRWEELERKNQENLPKVPMSFAETLRLAAQQQEEIERKRKELECKNDEIIQLSSAITEMQPKVSYLELIMQDKRRTLSVTEIAQDYGMSAKAFNKLLESHRVQHKVNGVWIVYAPYIKEGYVTSVTKPSQYPHKDGSPCFFTITVWTFKGRAFLYHQLKEKGILPLIEQSAN